MKIDEGTTAAVVTGGASGLERASAYALAGAGAKVAVFDINEEGGRAVADDIGGIFCKVNILDEDSALDGFASARDAHGQERILVHCGTASARGLAEERAVTDGHLTRRNARRPERPASWRPETEE